MTQPSGLWKTKHAVILKETYIWGGNSNVGAGHLEICEDFETFFGGCQFIWSGEFRNQGAV